MIFNWFLMVRASGSQYSFAEPVRELKENRTENQRSSNNFGLFEPRYCRENVYNEKSEQRFSNDFGMLEPTNVAL